ncbi:tail fiber domain-containing protein [Flavilitoribacter nigricans]|uniref:Peptidase S74 domain-containing protein n=1 Tax=Flavilitoribacter nigricans (strain ATCC 23147 / DSM 23189 / NBRC 102662 / NCIMB 1420 / SS-2) TaxID=1122177 RepID=A0A2D0NHG6_FLAN2|nr:tail fiber domain-containing protein [Flavilitoribacter nigricans]PHN07935.1 hypothetical protein CRP01_04045 [Flavilitoribacter nigricans DSM 23189 = NBRC 102662]
MRFVTLLFICSFCSCFSLLAQLRLNVEGDAKISGRLDIAIGNDLFIGSNAGLMDPGSNAGNVFLGLSAGRLNQTGNQNTFIGNLSGYNNQSGTNNTFLGYQSGYSNQQGNSNTFVGNLTGSINSVGSEITLIGTAANVGYSGLINATAIGANAQVDLDNSLVLGNNANVGIGTSSPGAKLEVVGNRIRLVSATNSGKLLELRTDGGAVDVTATGGQLFLTGNNGAGVMMQQFSGNVGIGNDTSPDFKLEVVGTAGKPGGGLWSDASDKRLKTDVEDFEDGLEQIRQIRPVWYRFRGDFDMPTKDRYVGVIAQEMQKVAPYTVTPYRDTDQKSGKSGDFLSYNGTAVIYMLVNAAQELADQVDGQQKIISELQSEITELHTLVRALKAGQNQTPDQVREITLEQKARLSQNFPNPFHERTLIDYYLPETAHQAQLEIRTIDGKVLETIALPQTGEGQLQIKAARFPAGTYLYSLVVDNEVLDTKRMVLTK